ncbi:MAG: hypothetical protein FP831_12155 [Anaerolineae bacterium]|nr:hypothetical protein [Anaerolineae bacterium]
MNREPRTENREPRTENREPRIVIRNSSPLVAGQLRSGTQAKTWVLFCCLTTKNTKISKYTKIFLFFSEQEIGQVLIFII